MSIQHVSWFSIELFHNCVRTFEHLAALGRPRPVVEYRAKVKLHGANCAVQVTPEGVFAQSRTQLLSPEADYKGFAAWVHANRHWFASLESGIVVFGEWCGPGVEKGMAISSVSARHFVVFAIQAREQILFEPEVLRAKLTGEGAPPELRVLPWEGAPILVDFGSRESLEHAAVELNRRVAEVEREDPWVKAEFGISGLGEGLVLYPVRMNSASLDLGRDELATAMFKAKGEKHRTAGGKTAVAVDAAAVASVQDFVALMVTDARLRQGLEAACGGARDPKQTAAFIAWMAADVQKESVAELEASGLAWSQVDKAVRAAARTWFLRREAA
ncbi:MAG TPA: RNA ligase family protein [Burkholderiaceae bacterium]